MNAAPLTTEQIRSVAAGAGFTGQALDIAVAVALAESSGRPDAIGDRNRPRSGCSSVGLWQINSCPGRDDRDPFRGNPAALKDPARNAAAAWSISSRGTNWSPWTTYRTGAYRRFMPPPGQTGRPPIASLVTPPIIGPGLPAQVPVLAAGADQIAPWLDLAAKLVDWDTWRRVIYVVLALLAAGAGIVIITRDTISQATR